MCVLFTAATVLSSSYSLASGQTTDTHVTFTGVGLVVAVLLAFVDRAHRRAKPS